MSFKAERISESRQITLNGDLKAVFPLFGPIEESKWAPGWAPNITSSMNAAIEEHMIFTTKAHHAQEADYTWIVSKYEPERRLSSTRCLRRSGCGGLQSYVENRMAMIIRKLKYVTHLRIDRQREYDE